MKMENASVSLRIRRMEDTVEHHDAAIARLEARAIE